MTSTETVDPLTGDTVHRIDPSTIGLLTIYRCGTDTEDDAGARCSGGPGCPDSVIVRTLAGDY